MTIGSFRYPGVVTCHAWRGDAGGDHDHYADVPGFSKAASLDEVRAHSHVLTPGRYVGAAAREADGEPFAEKMARLSEQLESQFKQSEKLQVTIRQVITSFAND